MRKDPCVWWSDVQRDSRNDVRRNSSVWWNDVEGWYDWDVNQVQKSSLSINKKQDHKESGAVVFSWNDPHNIPLEQITDVVFRCEIPTVYRFDNEDPLVAYSVVCADNKQDALDAVLDVLPENKDISRNKLLERITHWEEGLVLEEAWEGPCQWGERRAPYTIKGRPTDYRPFGQYQ